MPQGELICVLVVQPLVGVAGQDEDPYVRKTAAVCVAKLHDINSTLVEDQGFLDLLKDLLSDSVPMVTAVILYWHGCSGRGCFARWLLMR